MRKVFVQIVCSVRGPAIILSRCKLNKKRVGARCHLGLQRINEVEREELMRYFVCV